MKIRNQKGQGVVEYLLLVALMGVATIGMLKLLQSGVNTQLANVVLSLRGEKRQDLRPSAPSKKLYREQDMSEFSNHATDKDN